MDTLVIHALNALLYASVMFLIAGGLSLIYGVMRIVNLAHGNLYAFGAYVAAWAAGLVIAHLSTGLGYLALAAGALAAAGRCAVLDATPLRPLYPRAEEDQVLVTFVVVVIGGLDSLEGALVGALLVGVVREAGITFFPEIELAVLYLMAAVVLLVRPAGLFGRA